MSGVLIGALPSDLAEQLGGHWEPCCQGYSIADRHDADCGSTRPTRSQLRAAQQRLEEAQRHALYADYYRAIAAYHLIHCCSLERAQPCFRDAERCHAFAVAIVFGPWPELR